MSKKRQLLQKYFEKKSRKMQKSGCSLCKTENPLYEKISSKKNLLLNTYFKIVMTLSMLNFMTYFFEKKTHFFTISSGDLPN